MSKTSDGITNSKRHRASLSNEDKDLKGILNMCRVCLMTGDIPIFGEINISADISEFGGVKVSENDKLPQYICEDCHTLLESAQLFKCSARKSFQILSQLVDYLQNNTEFEPIKAEDAPVVIRKDLHLEHMNYLESNCSKSGTDNISIKNLKICPEADRSSSEENSDVKVEYLEYGDTTADEESNASLPSVYLAVQDSTFSDSKVHVNKSASKSRYNDDMFPIIVPNSEKGDDNSSNRILKNPEDFEKKNITKNIENQATCDVCQDVVSIKHYKVHMELHRDKYKEKALKRASRKIECKICDKVFSSTYYKFHMKMHGSNVDQATRLRKCHLCDKSFSANYFNDHMKRVHSDKKWITNEDDRRSKLSKDTNIMQCPVCDKKVKELLYKTHLQKHEKPPKKYVCDKCGMVTANLSSFKTHSLTHGSELKFKCKFCPYRGLHHGLLRIHMRTHSGDYNYKCTECSSRFLTKSNLTQHLRVHRLPVDFKCKACNRGFYTKRSMDKHYKNMHLKLKTHVCEICGKGFGHRDNMLSHQIKVHNRKRLITKGRLPSYLRPEHNSNREKIEEI